MKAAICMCVYNKNAALRNTLHSLRVQETEFPLEVYIFNDQSVEDPGEIVKEFAPDANYVILPERTGGRITRAMYFKYLSDDIDVMIFMSADVMLLQRNAIQELVVGVSPGRFTMAEVKCHPVLPHTWRSFDHFSKSMLSMWNTLPCGKRLYQGQRRPDSGWYLFCSGILVSDVIAAGMAESGGCDAVFSMCMKSLGYIPNWTEHIKAIHQWHEYTQHPCPILSKCEYVTKFACHDRRVRQL